MTTNTTTRRLNGALSRMLTKIGVSLIFGVLAFLLSQGLDRPDPEVVVGIGVSVFISGIAFVVQFLIEVEGRIDDMEATHVRAQTSYAQHHAATLNAVRGGFARVNSGTDLYARLEQAGLDPETLLEFARNAEATAQRAEPLIVEFAQHEIARLSGYLRDLAHGVDVTYEGEDRDWLLGLTEVARKSIDATSLTTVDAGGQGFIDGGLWTSELGHLYLEAQEAAIKVRQVRVRRIFIIDRPGLRDEDDLRSIVRQHRDVGVEVKVLRATELPDTGTRRNVLFDFIVIDGCLSYQSMPAAQLKENAPPVIVNTALVTDVERVKQRTARFEYLWESARDIDGHSQ